MAIRLIRAEIKPDKVAEVDIAAKELFAAIAVAQPRGVHYASCRLADGITYVILLGLESDDYNPLGTVSAFTDFLRNLKSWIARLPTLEQLTLVGSYRLF